MSNNKKKKKKDDKYRSAQTSDSHLTHTHAMAIIINQPVNSAFLRYLRSSVPSTGIISRHKPRRPRHTTRCISLEKVRERESKLFASLRAEQSGEEKKLLSFVELCEPSFCYVHTHARTQLVIETMRVGGKCIIDNESIIHYQFYYFSNCSTAICIVYRRQLKTNLLSVNY